MCKLIAAFFFVLGFQVIISSLKYILETRNLNSPKIWIEKNYNQKSLSECLFNFDTIYLFFL